MHNALHSLFLTGLKRSFSQTFMPLPIHSNRQYKVQKVKMSCTLFCRNCQNEFVYMQLMQKQSKTISVYFEHLPTIQNAGRIIVIVSVFLELIRFPTRDRFLKQRECWSNTLLLISMAKSVPCKPVVVPAQVLCCSSEGKFRLYCFG